MPPAIVETQQDPQDQQEDLPGGSGMSSGSEAPRVANPPQTKEQQTKQRSGNEEEPGMVTRKNRRKSSAPRKYIKYN